VSTASAPVVIVGAGPVGLSTALGLAHHGVQSILVERVTTPSVGSKAFGVWGRTLEVFDAWGLSRALLDAGDPRDAISPVRIDTGRPIFTIDFACLAGESPMPGLLLIPQNSTERVLRDAAKASALITWVSGEAVAVETDDAGQDGAGHDDADHDDAGVTVRVRTADGFTEVRGTYLVGADGSRSVVRESQGVRHVGRIIDIDLLVFDVEVPDEPVESVVRIDSRKPGLLAALRFAPGRWRVLASMRALRKATTIPADGPPPRKPPLPVEELASLAAPLFGREGLAVTWQSQTTLYQQRVPHFRLGRRILLAGDAAHLISPAGGQGMNQGIQDAENLAFSLASALNGGDADAMLDGYARERERIADVVARRAHLNTLLEFATPTWSRPFAFWGMRLITRQRWVMRLIARRLSMRDLRYRAGGSERLVGRRAVGRRLADVTLPRGTRLSAALCGKGGVVTIATAVAPELNCPEVCVSLEHAPARSRLRRRDIAVIRPDRTIAAVLRRPSQSQLDAALLLAGVTVQPRASAYSP
jgi:2-polyprenyl-6-methoxyphenol hydroxylase-like FAD-dependent oxidoreductase